MTWVLAEDDNDAETLGRLIGALDALLKRERAAIARLDAAQVEALAADKQALAQQLALALAPPETTPVVRFAGAASTRVRRELRRLAARLLASVEANRALLDDAIESIASARGLRPPQTGAYDSRARVTQRVRTAGGKRI